MDIETNNITSDKVSSIGKRVLASVNEKCLYIQNDENIFFLQIELHKLTYTNANLNSLCMYVLGDGVDSEGSSA